VSINVRCGGVGRIGQGSPCVFEKIDERSNSRSRL